MRWGFFHLGRFSQYYRDLFGEHPIEALRRAKGTRPQKSQIQIGSSPKNGPGASAKAEQ
jgi:AraC family ethanolamine operon transcriptional activator